MKKIKVFYNILRITKTIEALSGFLSLFFLTAFILTFIEPSMENFGDSIWFCFASVTTIGYGDLYVSSILGRIITAILSLYGIIMIAVVNGNIVSFIGEFQRIKAKESVENFLEKLEHLENLSKEDLQLLSERIRNRKFHF